MAEDQAPPVGVPLQVVGADGYAMTTLHYRAVGSPKAIVACLHGIQSHAGWYLRSCQALAAAGYETYFLDRRGSGANALNRGDCRGFRQLLDDVERYVATARDRHPGLPVVLLGISWGGKLACAALKRRPELVQGLVLVAPGTHAKIEPTLPEKLRIAGAWMFRPDRRLPIPLNDPALFTATPKWREFLANDPLALREGSARLLMASRALDRVLWTAPSRVRVPLLLQLASEDRIIDNGKVRRFVERFASTDKQVREYEGAHHTLEFEPDPRPIFVDQVAWLDAHFA